ncbi:MAG: PilZ domain-containing protein [Polyangiales bacterium]
MVVVTAPRGSARIYPCVWTDVSYGGAGLSLAHRVEVGEAVRCEWSASQGSGAVTARIVWCQQGRVGVRTDFRDEAERAAWITLIDQVRASLRSTRALPREAQGEPTPHRTGPTPRLSTAGVMAVVPEVVVARHTPRGGVVREVSETLPDLKRRTRDPRSEE